MFHSDYIILSIYLVVSLFYFWTALYFSHYTYRHFKYINQQGLLNNQEIFRDQANSGTGYYQMQNPMIVDNSRTPNTNYYQGQGVPIG
jgi:hypothetical protein